MRDAVQILLVEDNPDDVDLALYALNKHNLANNIEIARDGVEALAFLFGPDGNTPRPAEAMPKLILLDLKLPLVNGLEVLRRVKGDASTRLIPVVVLTTSHEDRDVMESYTLGVNSYIVKPVDFSQFVDAARQIGYYWLLLNQPPARDGG